MYPLAQILHSQGYYLTGSDNNETETLDAVRKMGIPVYVGQRAENIEGADLIVHTAAIMNDNPELIAARNSDAEVLERSELLGIITGWYDRAICVSGTHGKTTTTSMITQILFSAGIDLSAFIGGKLPCIGGSGRAGKSDIMGGWGGGSKFGATPKVDFWIAYAYHTCQHGFKQAQACVPLHIYTHR